MGQSHVTGHRIAFVLILKRMGRLFGHLIIALLLFSATGQQQSGCEKGKVPAQLKVWPDGRPELFCHWPSCHLFSSTFASSAEGKANGNDAMRCNAALSDAVCDLPDEWTAALVEANNGTHISLLMQCCAVANLSEWAAPLKQVVLAPGEQFGGGPVLHNGEMVAFDVIKEVRKKVTPENDVRYVVSVFRVLCVSAPPVSPNSAFSARSILTRLSGVRFSSGGTDADVNDQSVAAGKNASQNALPDAASRRERPSYALMRKALQKAGEWRRRPLQRKEPSPPSDIASTTAALTTSATTGSGRAASTAAAYASPATYKTFGQLLLTSPSDVNNSDGDDISVDDGALSTTSVRTMPSTSATSDHLNAPKTALFTSTQRQPFYAKQKYRPFWSDRSAEGAEKSPDSDDILAPSELNGGGRSADGRIAPWARVRKVSTTADVVKWREKGGGLKKYAGGLKAIRHQMDGISPSMSAERSVKAEPKMPKERHGVAAVKPKTYASGVETYASPLKDIQLLDVGSTSSSSTSNSDEDNLQSVVEQHQLDEALLREMSAAISEKAMAQEIVGRDEIGVKMLPQETTTTARHLENPFPSILNSYIDPPQSLVGAADCAAKSVAIRSGKSGGCDDGTAPAEAELILSCGSCSCSRCQCSSLPETCNGQNCPICPSVCQCPTECGCEASSSSFNSFQNGVELAESQAVQQPSQQQQYYNMPWSGQQFYSGGQEGYGAVGGTALNAAFDTLQCFSGDQLVRTARGAVRMDELLLGDLVLSMDESLILFSPVVMFLHRKPSESANFVRIHTELGHRLQLTGLHLLWVGCSGRLRLIRARELRPGQCVYALDGREMEKEKILWRRRGNKTERVWQRERAEQLRMVASRIERIEQVNDRGIYAPLTANGNILVNDVLASCHVNMAAQTLQQTFFNWWRALTAFGHKIRTIAFASGLWNFADECCRTGQNQPAGDGQQQQQHNFEGDLPLGVRLVISVLDSLMPDSILLPPIN